MNRFGHFGRAKILCATKEEEYEAAASTQVAGAEVAERIRDSWIQSCQHESQ